MRASVTGLRARMRKVDDWIEEVARKAKWRRMSRMSIEEKRQMLREMLPSIPPDHPARAMAEKILGRYDQSAGPRPQ